MTEVNLLPPELRRRQRSRQRTLQVVAGSAAIVLLLLILFLFESARLGSANRSLDAQNGKNAALQNQINGLQAFAQLKDGLDQRRTLVGDLEQATVQWSGILHDLSMVIPTNVYLTDLAGSITIDPGGEATQVTPTGLIGSLQFQGLALEHPDVALWLERLAEVEGWVNPWVSSESKGSSGSGSSGGDTVTFTGTVDLGQDAAHDGTPP